jgi:hypothetical protein
MPAARPILLILVVLALASAVGCGSSDGGSGYGPHGSTGAASTEGGETATATTPPAPPGAAARTCEGTVAGTDRLRVTGIDCDLGRGVVAAWANAAACSEPADASRFSCSVHDGYRCLGAVTERGIAVSCARPGSSVAFVAKNLSR